MYLNMLILLITNLGNIMICAEDVKKSTNGQPIRDTPDAASLWYLYSRSFVSSLNAKVKNFVCLFKSLQTNHENINYYYFEY